ncbi:MAG: Uma2 family endonuclease [Microcoleus sp. PH2017_10_PVI_O_A]|uniref:Uma2 family endonuclease n=1 Tax=unclassified Microcoleus TaxID=2642155 RepID=UPI001E0F7E71|nr:MULTISPECIES: Uma2 family endonuclease [unclassified Microcoleus]TAE83945.1 MAG: Uma2 family endonuclease [Oscillatoriales cyanobacterium]MCC3405717.1 Uma2 family endonuclease [Microcoleus sp. PH2017_10_PVI_O_A]MCC3460873.1 Uma2 family endonuclease [Microcoleus sp. PH2017_11_PCY_U_A]MCC3478182.1 Uma2 family endonuclease [Microcoleus sp. PH2017_12_PCY_D_A]MCC3559055.1 Uma2 family endonuclease [Microcoleus sp. PH2017_27_LUM_O_A]
MSEPIVPVNEENQVDDSPTLTFEEYRVYQGEPDVQYELYKGKLLAKHRFESIPPVLTEQPVDNSPTLTFEEYRVYQGESDVKYELYKGKLIPMPTATVLHIKICEYLVYKIQRYLATHNLDLVVKTGLGVRTNENKSRIPDVVVCTQSLLEQAAARPGAGILDFDEKPLLVIEVVSENRPEYYIIKRAEYNLADVPEYWIADPKQNKGKLRVLAFPEDDDIYEQNDYLPGQQIESVLFPDLVLLVDEILNPPLVEELVKAEQARLQQLEQEAVIERQRAERLAAKLRELGVDSDTV